MSGNAPLLACGSIHISPGYIALFFALLGSWAVSFVLAFFNLSLVSALRLSPPLKAAHFGVFLTYVFMGISLSGGIFPMYPAVVAIIIFGVPVLVVTHFAILRRLRKRERLREMKILE